MTTQQPTTETTGTSKPKRQPRGTQPKTHAGKSRAAAQARRKVIVNALLDGKTNSEAGIAAGLSPKTAFCQVSNIIKEPKTQNALLAAMERRGMGDDYLALHHQMLIEGTKVISAIIITPGSQTDLADAGSMTKDFIEVPDLQAKAKGLEMIYKLTGRYVEKHEVDVKPGIIVEIRKFCSRGTPPTEGTQG